ncbi:hypothetical protein H4W33_007248 [Kibdelosporangium phytohabitans]|nr:hypothetical protein [Kibdelosporangium phytohabitans]
MPGSGRRVWRDFREKRPTARVCQTTCCRRRSCDPGALDAAMGWRPSRLSRGISGYKFPALPIGCPARCATVRDPDEFEGQVHESFLAASLVLGDQRVETGEGLACPNADPVASVGALVISARDPEPWTWSLCRDAGSVRDASIACCAGPDYDHHPGGDDTDGAGRRAAADHGCLRSHRFDPAFVLGKRGDQKRLPSRGRDLLRRVPRSHPVLRQELRSDQRPRRRLGLAGWPGRPRGTTIPDPRAPNGAIYAFWDALVIDDQAGVWTHLDGGEPNRRYTVEWRDVTIKSARAAGSARRSCSVKTTYS